MKDRFYRAFLKARSEGKSILTSLTIASAVIAPSAHAAVPVEITDALTALGVDALLLVTAGIVVWATYKPVIILWGIGGRVLSSAFRK